MAFPGGAEGRDGACLGCLHPQHSRGRTPVGLLGAITSALPGNEGPAHGQERRRILDEDRQRSESAGGHEVVRTDALRPVLGPGLDRLDVDELQALDGAAQERDLPTDALHGRHARIRKRDRQHQPRKPAPRAEIGDPPRIPDLGQLERDERVRDMRVHPLRWIPNRGDRAALGRDKLQQQRQPIRRSRPQAVAVSEVG